MHVFEASVQSIRFHWMAFGQNLANNVFSCRRLWKKLSRKWVRSPAENGITCNCSAIISPTMLYKQHFLTCIWHNKRNVICYTRKGIDSSHKSRTTASFCSKCRKLLITEAVTEHRPLCISFFNFTPLFPLCNSAFGFNFATVVEIFLFSDRSKSKSSPQLDEEEKTQRKGWFFWHQI